VTIITNQVQRPGFRCIKFSNVTSIEHENTKKKLKFREIFNTPTRRLNNADLPTFGLPTIATLWRRWSGICHSN